MFIIFYKPCIPSGYENHWPVIEINTGLIVAWGNEQGFEPAFGLAIGGEAKPAAQGG